MDFIVSAVLVALYVVPRVIGMFDPRPVAREVTGPTRLYANVSAAVLVAFAVAPMWAREQLKSASAFSPDEWFIFGLVSLTSAWVGWRLAVGLWRREPLRFGPSWLDIAVAAIGTAGFLLFCVAEGPEDAALPLLAFLFHGLALAEAVLRRVRDAGLSIRLPPLPPALAGADAATNVVGPVRGPVRLVDLMCLVRSNPILAHRRPRLWGVARSAGGGLLFGLAAIAYVSTQEEVTGWDALGYVLGLVMLGPLVSGPLALLIGSHTGAVQVSKWRRSERLDELRLTALRPLTVCQLILRVPLLQFALAAAPLLVTLPVAIALPLRDDWSEGLAFGLLTAALVANGFISVLVGAWARAAFSLSGSWPLSTARTFGLIYAILIWDIAILWVFIAGAPMLDDFLPHRFEWAAAFSLAVALFAVHFAVRIWLAKAYARQLERVVFPRLGN